MTLFILQHVTNSYGTFGFDELQSHVFLTQDSAYDFILQVAKREYPDADPDVFEDIEALEDYLTRLYNDDKPVLMFEVLEIYPEEQKT